MWFCQWKGVEYRNSTTHTNGCFENVSFYAFFGGFFLRKSSPTNRASTGRFPPLSTAICAKSHRRWCRRVYPAQLQCHYTQFNTALFNSCCWFGAGQMFVFRLVSMATNRQQCSVRKNHWCCLRLKTNRKIAPIWAQSCPAWPSPGVPNPTHSSSIALAAVQTVAVGATSRNVNLFCSSHSVARLYMATPRNGSFSTAARAYNNRCDKTTPIDGSVHSRTHLFQRYQRAAADRFGAAGQLLFERGNALLQLLHRFHVLGQLQRKTFRLKERKPQGGVMTC